MAHTVDVGWTASVDPVDGYNVLRGTVSGGPYTKVNSALVTGTSFVDVGPFSNLGPFFYVAESVKGSVVSIFSNEVQVLLPPAPPTALVLISAT
jgi:hypothetical protein